MRTTIEAAPVTASRPANLNQLANALRKGHTSKALHTIESALKEDRSTYTKIMGMCDHFQAKDEIRLRCHEVYYQYASTPSDKAIGAINAAHIPKARAKLSVRQFLRHGPFAIVLAQRAEDSAIEWLQRAQRTGLSGADASLVSLLMQRSSRLFAPQRSAVGDHLKALRVVSEALERGHFYPGHLAALEKHPMSPKASLFIGSTIVPRIRSYRCASDSLPFYRECQLQALARARTILNIS